MLSMSLLNYFSAKKEKKKIRALPKLEQGVAKFNRKYPNYKMGYGSYGLPLVHDWQEGSTLEIGSFCSIAENVNVFLGGHHQSKWITTFPFPAFIKSASHIEGYAFSRGDVIIGSDVWLCTGAVILSGVHIGHGAVIAAGAVVTKNVEPYSIVAGNPACHIRYRFKENDRLKLLKLEWWNWPVELISSAVPILCSGDTEELFKYYEKYVL